MTFEEYYRSLPKEKNDTILYDLRKAWQLLPKKDLENFKNNKNAHLKSVAYDSNQGIYYFLKHKNHPTINKELEWYNSKEAEDFKSKYKLDTTGNYFKYIPISTDSLNYINYFTQQ